MVHCSSSGSRYRPTWRPRREALNIDSIFTRQKASSVGHNPSPGPSLPQEPQDLFPLAGPAPPSHPGAQVTEGREVAELEAGIGLVGQPRTPGARRAMGPPAPPPLRGVEHQPRLIQRMESGYESSERNSSSPDRCTTLFYSLFLSVFSVQFDFISLKEQKVQLQQLLIKTNYTLRIDLLFRPLHREVGQQKRVLMSGPSWRSVPKSKSSSAILQELCASSSGAGTNTGVCQGSHLHRQLSAYFSISLDTQCHRCTANSFVQKAKPEASVKLLGKHNKIID